MKQIAIIGECMIELNGKPFAEMQQTFGGDTLNLAVYLSRAVKHKLKVNYVSTMGTDALSEGILARWRDEGVNSDFVLRDQKRQAGLYLIQLDEQGERTFLYWRNQSAARYLLQHPKFPELANKLQNMDMVCLSGISLAILPKQDRERLVGLLNHLARQNVQIVFDSNFRPSLWSHDIDWKTVRRIYQQVFSVCDIALVTFDDEQALWGDETPQETLIRLKTSGVKEAIVKLGAEGCLYQNFTLPDSVSELISTEVVANVVDTTSAGDAFNAGFFSGYLLGLKPQMACKQGHQLAGAVIQHKGAIVPIAATEPITALFTDNNCQFKKYI